MKAVAAAFNQEKVLVGTLSMITIFWINLRFKLYLEVVVLAGGQQQVCRAVVGVEQDHGQQHPPLVVRQVRREVSVSGDEHDARPRAAAVDVREPPHQLLQLLVRGVLLVGGDVHDVDLRLVEVLEDGAGPLLSLRELDHIAHHGELDLAVAAEELLVPHLGAHAGGGLAVRHVAVLYVPEDAQGAAVLLHGGLTLPRHSYSGRQFSAAIKMC